MAAPPSDSSAEQFRSSCNHINVSIQSGQDDRVRRYRIKRDIPLRRLLLDYSSRLGLDHDSIRFIHEGQRVKDSTTAENLDMDDGAIIHALTEQHGGGFVHWLIFERCTASCFLF